MQYLPFTYVRLRTANPSSFLKPCYLLLAVVAVGVGPGTVAVVDEAESGVPVLNPKSVYMYDHGISFWDNSLIQTRKRTLQASCSRDRKKPWQRGNDKACKTFQGFSVMSVDRHMMMRTYVAGEVVSRALAVELAEAC
jgi:hypothetical protein